MGFEEAYHEHRLALLRLAYLMSGSHDVSEDVVQSVFTSAHGRWEQIEKPLPYLKRAVVNAVKDGQPAEVGDSLVWVYAVHPEVDTVRITSGDYTKDLRVYEVDGAGYAPFEIPEDMNEYTSELLIDGQVVPGSAEDHEVRRR